MEEQIRIALPSKGRMERETLEFLAACNLVANKRNPRQYFASIPALPGVQVLFQRAHDIPIRVQAGDVDLGITGFDTLMEQQDILNSVIVIHDELGYGECSLALAVPEEWNDVRSMNDLTKKATTQNLRIATSYTNITRRYLDKAGLQNVQIINADGALESAPAIGYAEFIADLVSTGTTLRENRLRQIDGGTILDSQAILIGNRSALAERPQLLAIVHQLLEFIDAYLRAKGQYHIFVNMRGESMEEIGNQIFSQTDLAGLQGPTISPMITRNNGGNWWAVNLVTPAHKLYKTIQQIREIGGSGVVVTPVTYIFEEESLRYQKLLKTLQTGASK
jgi:ATP phosphoribosyltransferase